MSNQPTAIVTGAGSGIGKQTAIQLREQGYRVVLVGRTRAKLEATAQQCTDTLVIEDDLAKPLAASRIVAAAGRVDALAHVAGHAPNMPINDLTSDVITECMEINLGAAARLAAAAWEPLKQSDGVIVNVSSVASIDPFPGFAIYAAAKVGVNMFTRCIAQEGVRAVTVAPGAVETPMLRGIFDEAAIPRDKTLDPADVARVIVGCITGERAFESGEVIVVPSP